MSWSRSDFVAGMKDVAPALPAFIPFGVIVGITARNTGFTSVETIMMSALLFSGTVQLAVIELVRQDAVVVVTIATGVVIGLRYMMYSASIAPYFKGLPAWWRWGLSFFLLEVTYVFSVSRYETEHGMDPRWYYLGVALPLWAQWVLATAFGVFIGVSVPASWQLDFAVPLIFIALLFSAITDRTSIIAGGIAGTIAVVGVGLPLNTGLIAATIIGVGVGLGSAPFLGGQNGRE